MRRMCSLALALATVFSSTCLQAAPTREPHDLRVMTFNVRYASPNDGINVWPKRRDLMVHTILAEHPDILGTQELLLSQADYLKNHLPHYAWFGRGRNGNEVDKNDNEHMGVFYDTTRLALLKHGDFWYSDTPDVPGSMSFGQPMPRMVTWAEFRDRKSGKRFYYYDTHFPYKKGAAAEAIRERCAAELLAHLAKLPHDLPFVLTGDFNSLPDSGTHADLAKVLHDAWATAPAHAGPAFTFHGFTGVPTKRIDWIWYRGLQVQMAHTDTTHQGKVFPSDHYPVVADFDWAG